MSQFPGDMGSILMSRRSGRFPNDGGYDGSGWAGAIAAKQNSPSGQFGLGGMRQDQQLGISHDGPGSMGSIIKPAIAIPDFQQHFNAQRDAQMRMQDRLAGGGSTGIAAPGSLSPFGKSLRQENPYRPSPPRRGPGGFGGGGFGGGSQGIDQFMDFMQQMMQMFKQFNSQGGGGGYGQGRGPGGFPQSPWASSQRYGQYQPQPAILRTQGPASMMPQFGWGGPSGREQSLGLMQTAGPESFQPLMQTQGHF